MLLKNSRDNTELQKDDLGNQITELQNREMLNDKEYTIINESNQKKTLDQIEQDHNIIAAGYDEECDQLHNNNNDIGYIKYLNQEEKKTLEQLQDKTQMSIEKYKDLCLLSSQKKNSDIFSECYDQQSLSNIQNSCQYQSCISFNQFQTAKQNQDQKMYESQNSYQSDKYNGFNVNKLHQQESDIFGEETNSNNNIQQQLFQYNEDISPQNNSNILQGENYFPVDKISNSISTIKSRGGQSTSFFNDKSNGADCYQLASIQESEELGKNNNTNSSSYPQPYIQTSSQIQVGSSELLSQFELYRQQMKKENGSKQSTPKSYNEMPSNKKNKQSLQYLEQNIREEELETNNQEVISHQQISELFEKIQQSANKKVHFSIQQQQKQLQQTPQKQTSQERERIAYINKRCELDPEYQAREPYHHSSGFSFDKYQSIQKPQSTYTSFKYKSNPNSSPDSRQSPNNLQHQSQEVKEYIVQPSSFTSAKKSNQLQIRKQNQDDSLVNSMIHSNSVRMAFDSLNNAVQTPVRRSPRQNISVNKNEQSPESSQMKENKKYSKPITKDKKEYKSQSKQSFNENKSLVNITSENLQKKEFEHIKMKGRNQIQQQQQTPNCFNYLNENSNTSILKNTLIQWFENEKIQFQNQIDQLVITSQSFNQIQQSDTVKQNKFIVSDRELNRLEDFLIEFEVSLTQNNGVINQSLEARLQEFLNKEGAVVFNRITNKKPSTEKHKQEDLLKNKIEQLQNNQSSQIGNEELNNLQQSNSNKQQLSPQSIACYKIVEVDEKIQRNLKSEQQIFNYTFHKKILQDLTDHINLKTIIVKFFLNLIDISKNNLMNQLLGIKNNY